MKTYEQENNRITYDYDNGSKCTRRMRGRQKNIESSKDEGVTENKIGNGSKQDEESKEDTEDKNTNESDSDVKYPVFEDEFSVVANLENGEKIYTGMPKVDFLALADKCGWDMGEEYDEYVRDLDSLSTITVCGERSFSVYFLEEPDGTVTIKGFAFDSVRNPNVTFGEGLTFDVDLDEMAKHYTLIKENYKDSSVRYKIYELAPNLNVTIINSDDRIIFEFLRVDYIYR